METLIISIVGVVCTLIGAYVGIKTYKKNMEKEAKNHEKEIKKEAEEETKQKVELLAKINMVLDNNDEIKRTVMRIDDKFDNYQKEINEKVGTLEKRVLKIETKMEKERS